MAKSVKYYPEVDILEHDDSTAPETKRVMNYGWDTKNLRKVRLGVNSEGSVQTSADNALKLTQSGNYTYLAIAAPGTAQATAAWQVKRLDETSGIVITWADGDAEFDNVATDLTTLDYS